MTKSKSTDHLDILVFRKNRVSRSFQVPLKWITRWVVGVGFLLVIAFFCVLFALKWAWRAYEASPERVAVLQREVADLRAQCTVPSSVNAVVASAVVPTPSPFASASAAPIVVAVATPVVTPSVSAPVVATRRPAPVLVQGSGFIPPMVTLEAPSRDSLPFKITPAQAVWQGKNLKIRFAIQYTQGDGGNQQGRIVIFARGAQANFGYPDQANRMAMNGRVPIGQGEFFSVSRYREVRAQFNSITNQKSITQVEIYLLDGEGNLLLTEIIAPRADSGSVSEGAE